MNNAQTFYFHTCLQKCKNKSTTSPVKNGHKELEDIIATEVYAEPCQTSK